MGNEVKKHIKAFATLCSLAMVFSIFSASVLADDPVTGGGAITQATIDDNGGKMPVIAGNYTLDGDVNVSDTAQIEVSDTVITIDLAGHTITYFGSGSMYIVGKVTPLNNGQSGQIDAGNVQLTICDSVGGGKITTGDGYTGGGSTDVWVSRKDTNNSSAKFGTNTGRGGCILIQYSSKFTLSGGTINGFKANDEGGAVQVSNGAEFVMTGGAITNCSAKNGGGVAVHTASKGRTSSLNDVDFNIAGKATITGGTISGNHATENGGGVRVLRGDFYLGSCKITGNSANGTGDNGGGGLSVHKADFTQYLEIVGNPQIYKNTGKDADRNNLFFYKSAAFTLTSNMDSTADIHFGAKSMDTGAQYFKVGTYSYDLSSFTCDNISYEPYYNSSKKAVMVKKLVVPSVAGSRVSVGGNIELKPQVNFGTYDDDNASVSYSYSYTKNGKTTTRTNSFTKAQLTKVGSNYEFSIPVESACMTAPIEITITYGTEGDTVTKTVSIEQYVKGMLADTTGTYTQGQKDVAEALLIYGGYAQVQLGIYADQLPDIGVDFSQAYTSGLQGAAYTITKDTNNAYYGVSVSFLTNTEIKMYFKKSVLGDTAPSMVIDGYSEPIAAKESGSYYVYVVKGASGNGFPATQYDVSFNFSIGEDISGSYSVETYLKAIKNNDNSSAAMKNLAEAYNNFAQKCIALTTA